MMTYEETMASGAAEYADVVAALQARGLRAEFTQTGGMCAAIAVRLEGAELLITDAEDSLSWSQDEHDGWGVSMYSLDVQEEREGPIRDLTTYANGLDDLLSLVTEILAPQPSRCLLPVWRSKDPVEQSR